MAYGGRAWSIVDGLLMVLKVHALEAFLDGKRDILDWDPVNFEPFQFSPLPPYPTCKPPTASLEGESVEVREYIELLEVQARAYVLQATTLEQDTKTFIDLVDKLNSEVVHLHDRTEDSKAMIDQSKKKKK